MNYYNKNVTSIPFASPAAKLTMTGTVINIFSLILFFFSYFIRKNMKTEFLGRDILIKVGGSTQRAGNYLLVFGMCVWFLALVLFLVSTPASRIKRDIRRGLFYPPLGNPLHLKDGEKLPSVKVAGKGEGIFEVTITATSCSIEELADISGNISSSLGRKFSNYAVTQTCPDIAMNYVSYILEDVTVHREIHAKSVDDLMTDSPTKLVVQQGTFIDLTTSGSILVAGKTRSGKTTGIISLLLQVLRDGPDKYGSQVVIIDPKKAELSRLKKAVTLEEDGNGRKILQVIQEFLDGIVKRQKILNDLSVKTGNAVHWWDAGFHVSMLFIDEYVSIRTVFPTKASKDDPQYCLNTFDDLLKRIVTMGASAGCYVIISIAEASVSEGGLPAMLRSAMTTKILFRPSLIEGAFLWDREKLRNLTDRTYLPGDAWFSSTDGKHDNVVNVHFPVMDFPVYRELGRLLQQYYRE